MPYSIKTPFVVNTNQTTTLGAVVGTTLNTTGLITANGGVIIPSNINSPGNSLYIVNSNSGGSAYTSCLLGNNTGNNFVMFLNSSTRTDDGGVNTATVRNDAGPLRLQSANGAGMSIATDGSTTFSGAISGINATFSTTLGVTGLTTLSGGLTSTAGTTTLGTTNILSLTASTALALDASKNIISVTNTGTGNNVLSASPTISGTLTTSAISATSGTFSTTLGVTGLMTANGGVNIPSNGNNNGNSLYVVNSSSDSSSYSDIALGNNTANALHILLNSSNRSADGGVNTATVRNDAGALRLQSNTGGGISIISGLATFDSGLTSTAGTTILGTTTIGAITGTSASFSTTLGVTGLATFGAGGLTSTAGTTTLGSTTIGAISGTSATFSTTLNTTGLITANGGVSIPSNINGPGNTFYLANSNTGTNAYSIFSIGNNTGNNLNMFLNSSTRTDDGGVNTATIRNDAGPLRLQSSGGTGITIATNGTTTIGAISGTSATFSSTLGVTGNSSVGSLTVNSSNIVARTISTNANWPFIFSATAGLGGSFLFCNDNAGTEYVTINQGSIMLNVYGNANIQSTTASTSNTTGGLTLAGGISSSNTTDATSSTNGGTITTAGGLAVAKKAFIGTDLSVGGKTKLESSTSSYTDSILNIVNNNTIPYASLTMFAPSMNSGQNNSIILGRNNGNINNAVVLNYNYVGDASSSNNIGISFAGGSELLSVIANGNVGIGNTNPGSKLTVNGSFTSGSIQTTNFSSISTQGGYLQWNRSAADGELWLINTTVGTNPGIRFGKSNLSNTVTELMRISDNGVVNISSTTTSTSNTTGGLTLAGGLGISNTTDATSSTNGGTITTAGGLAVAKKAFIGTDLNVGGNITRTAQLVVMTINNLQAIPTTIDWNTTSSGTLANMSLSHSSGTFTYSGSNPSTFYLNIGIYLTGATTGTFICEINFNGSILSRHGQYSENGGTILASTVINMSNTNTFSVYINGATGNANNSGSTFTWLRISQI